MQNDAMLALTVIQSTLKAPKGQRNKFGNYDYRSCEDILTALKPLLIKANCVVILSDSIELVGEERFYIKATAKIVSAVDGSEVSVSGYAREDATKKGMDLCQVTGAASSYARKYALNGLFAIDDSKDSDATNIGVKKTPAKTYKVTPVMETKKTPPLKDSDFDFDSSCPHCLKYGVNNCFKHKPK